MGIKIKPVPIPQETIEKVREDLKGDGIKIYELSDLPDEFIGRNLIHPEIFSKCATFVATVSGSHVEGRDYIFIAGLRRDKVGDLQVTDLDPIGMVFDYPTQSPAPSGIALFHGNFDGRTEVEVTMASTATTVETLEKKLTEEIMTFDEAPKRFTNAIHFVAQKYRDIFDDS